MAQVEMEIAVEIKDPKGYFLFHKPIEMKRKGLTNPVCGCETNSPVLRLFSQEWDDVTCEDCLKKRPELDADSSY